MSMPIAPGCLLRPQPTSRIFLPCAFAQTLLQQLEFFDRAAAKLQRDRRQARVRVVARESQRHNRDAFDLRMKRG